MVIWRRGRHIVDGKHTNMKLIEFELSLMLAIDEGDDNDDVVKDGDGNEEKKMWAKDGEIDRQIHIERERIRAISVWINESITIIGVTTFRIFDLSYSIFHSLFLPHPRLVFSLIMIIFILDLLVDELKSRQCQQLASNCILKYTRTRQHTCTFCRSPSHYTIIHITNTLTLTSVYKRRKFFHCISKRK